MRKLKTVIALFLLSTLLAEALPSANQAGTDIAGEVTERMESGGYVYLNVKGDQESRWVATRSTTAKIGDVVKVPSPMEMRNFTSKTLDRTFPSIYFAGAVVLEGDQPQAPKQAALPQGHPAIPSSPQAAQQNALPEGHPAIPSSPKKPAQPTDFESLTKPAGFVSITECYESREKLEGQSVRIKAIVTKYSPNILGSNWVRLKDGTGDDTLMVTTQGVAEVGDTVNVEGILSYDYDLGSGYKYPVIIKDAKMATDDSAQDPPKNP